MLFTGICILCPLFIVTLMDTLVDDVSGFSSVNGSTSVIINTLSKRAPFFASTNRAFMMHVTITHYIKTFVAYMCVDAYVTRMYG